MGRRGDCENGNLLQFGYRSSVMSHHSRVISPIDQFSLLTNIIIEILENEKEQRTRNATQLSHWMRSIKIHLKD